MDKNQVYTWHPVLSVSQLCDQVHGLFGYFKFLAKVADMWSHAQHAQGPEYASRFQKFGRFNRLATFPHNVFGCNMPFCHKQWKNMTLAGPFNEIGLFDTLLRETYFAEYGVGNVVTQSALLDTVV